MKRRKGSGNHGGTAFLTAAVIVMLLVITLSAGAAMPQGDWSGTGRYLIQKTAGIKATSEIGSEKGTEPGSEQSAENGTELASEQGAEKVTESSSEQGAEKATESSSDTEAGEKQEPETGKVTAPEEESETKPGQRPDHPSETEQESESGKVPDQGPESEPETLPGQDKETERETGSEQDGQPEEETERESGTEHESDTERETETEIESEAETEEILTEYWEDGMFVSAGQEDNAKAAKLSVCRDESLIFSFLQFPCYFKYVKNHGMDTDKTVAAYCLYNTLEAPENNPYQPNAEGSFSKEITYCLYNGCRYKGSRSYNSAYSTGNWKKDYYLTQVAVHIVNARQGRESSIEKQLVRSRNPKVYDLAYRMVEDAFADSSMISGENNQSMEISSTVSPESQNQWTQLADGSWKTAKTYEIKANYPERIKSGSISILSELPAGASLRRENAKNPLSAFWFELTDQAYRKMAREQTRIEAQVELSGTEYAGLWYVPASSSLKRQYITFLSMEETALVRKDTRRVKASVPELLFDVSLHKTDAESGTPAAGAVYGLYSDSACTKLTARFPATDQKGEAYLKGLKEAQDLYYVKEIQAPHGYLKDLNVYPVRPSQKEAVKVQVIDRRYSGTVKLQKIDAETGSALTQGDAVLEGAVYGLYAREPISHPDGTSGILFKKGEQAAVLKTDKSGRAEAKGLYPGKYYLKEISAPEGYVLDQKEYDVEIAVPGQDAQTVEIVREAEIKEQVIRQPFQLMKYSEADQETVGPLEGAGFTAWLLSDLEKDENGEYLTENHEPSVLGENGETELFTDESGYLCTIALPYGQYLVRETTVPANHEPVKDFIVTVSENKPDEPQPWIVLYDRLFTVRTKITKTDQTTGRPVLLPGAQFRIWDCKAENWLRLRDGDKAIDLFTTDASGMLTLPEKLRPGRYRLEEAKAPEGYLLSDQKIEFEISDHMAYLTDEKTGEPVLYLEFSDSPVSGRIEIQKTGEQPMLPDNEMVYQSGPLEGVRFEITAKEDIPYPDRRIAADGTQELIFRAGEKAEELVTDKNGFAASKELPLGTYEIAETGVPEGYLADEERQTVVLETGEENQKLVTEKLEIENIRRTFRIEMLKTDAETEQPLAGAEFLLYAGEEICDRDGAVLFRPGEIVDQCITGKDGIGRFEKDLPAASYYAVETKAPEGYQTSTKQFETDLRAEMKKADGQNPEKLQKVITVRLKAENEKEPEPETEITTEPAPKTGDNTPILKILAALLLSGMVLASCLFRKKM